MDFVCEPCVNLDTVEGLNRWEASWTAAASYVYNKTCRRWPGDCFEERTRPCIRKCWCPPASCSCGTYIGINLWDAFCLPIQEITEVRIVGGDCCPCNDTEIWTPDTGQYRLEWDGNCPWIVRQRTDGEQCCEWWPQQDLCRPDEAECTWSITARTGCVAPPEVLHATAGLAVEIVKECEATGCTPAAGASRVTTRGATFERDANQIGAGLWWDMLRDIFETWECTPSDFERFGNVGGSPNEPSFHKVYGPRRTAVTVAC
jgi:hypothetical protein